MTDSGDRPDSEQALRAVSPRVVSLRARHSENELERLNRLTGLSFDTLPPSLINSAEGLQLARDDGEELIYRALYLWGEQEKNRK